jgi:hypothetical protein
MAFVPCCIWNILNWLQREHLLTIWCSKWCQILPLHHSTQGSVELKSQRLEQICLVSNPGNWKLLGLKRLKITNNFWSLLQGDSNERESVKVRTQLLTYYIGKRLVFHQIIQSIKSKQDWSMSMNLSTF